MPLANGLYEFGPFCLNAGERVLLRDGRLVPLAPKALSTLLVLVKNRGHVVEKDLVIAEVWPDEVVEEGNLAQHIFILRKVLGETDEQVYIETIPRRGYRFVAAVNGFREGAAQATGNGSKGNTLNPETNGLLADLQSIAVLPFATLGAGMGDEYLGLGIADALITKLSKLKRVTVRPTSAVRNAVNADPVSAGKELQVATVLEGTIQKCEKDIRVTVQLVSVRDGATLWAEGFNEKFTNIFAIEDSISEQVARALAVKLTVEEQGQLAKHYTRNTRAYQAYLKGRYFFEKRSLESLLKSIKSFESAIRIDPNYALAYAGLADSYDALGAIDVLPAKESIPRAKEAAFKALSIEPNLAEGHAALGQAQLCDWDWQGAERSFQLAIALNPNYVIARHFYSIYLRNIGRFEESLAEGRKAEELDPTSAGRKASLAGTLYCARRYDDAIGELREALELDSNNAAAHYFLARIYMQKEMYSEAIAECELTISIIGERLELTAHLGHIYALSGRRAEAEKVLAELERLSIKDHVPSYFKALIQLGLGEKQQAFRLLEDAYREHDLNLLFVSVDPMLDKLRGHARFARLLQRMGLMPQRRGIASGLNGENRLEKMLSPERGESEGGRKLW
ncbi:MAG TPA: winged helix-turn-helix domain-containing protein [Pyrinomonadaceae bacterium]|jgi:DNA-binding winged helix-turn-helix (wHTH) protein/tetratricopeptide (TPR) repeat protein|nr:winged helix-turn-helix domain-containing protein [Pyrinomonadaceae bacterium]